MEFGRVTPQDPGKLDLALPVEPTLNENILIRKRIKSPEVYKICTKSGAVLSGLLKYTPWKQKKKIFLSIRHIITTA